MVDAYTGKQDAQVTQMFAQSRPDISLWCKQNHYEFVFEKGLSLDGSKCQWQKNLAEFFFLKSKEKGVAFEPKRLSDRTNEFNKFVLDIETEMLKTHNIYSSKDTLKISMENLLKHQGVSNAAINSIKKGEVKLDEAGINKILQHHKQPTKWMQEIRNILKNRNLPLNWNTFETVFKEHLDEMTEEQKWAMKDGHLDEKVIVDFLDNNPQFKKRFNDIVKGVFTPNINNGNTINKSLQRMPVLPRVQIMPAGDDKSAKLNEDLLDRFLTLHHEVGGEKSISLILEGIFAKPLAEQNEILSNEIKVLNENQRVLRKVPTLRNEVGEKKDISSELKKLSAKPLAEQNKSLSNEKKVLNENQRLLDKFLTLRHEVGEKKDISLALEKLSAKPLAEQNKSLSNAVNLLTNRKEKLELKLNNLTESALDIASKEAHQKGADKLISDLLNKLSTLETAEEKIQLLETLLKPGKGTKTR
jgi:hypothetical protein